MNLKSLELAGFKSFAKKSVLEFGSPITSIVGPNGSGKSNIAEAFRFVLGEQSIKSLRGKRGEDLIFNGSSEAPRSNVAKVKVVFDNSGRLFDMDFDEVSLERAVHRDSVNEYFINGSLVRLKDVLELLAKAHIGSSGHHIISQGEADRILNANMKERREMIEDALGLKIYLYKKQESLKKLGKTEENINSVELLRKEIQPHIKFLKKQVEKAEKARAMKETLRSLYKEYLKREDEYLRHNKNIIAEKRKEPKEKLARLESELAEAKRVLAASSEKDKKSEEVISLESALKEARVGKDSFVRDVGRIEGEIFSLERILKRQKEVASSEENKTVQLKEVEEMAGNLELHIKQALENNDLGFIRSALGKLAEIVSGFIASHKNKAVAGEALETEKEIETLKSQKISLDEKIKKAEKDEALVYSKYLALKDEIEKEKDTSRDAEKAVFKIMAEQNEVISKLNEIRSAEDKWKLEEENFKRELGEAGALLGRDVLDFGNCEPVNDKNEKISIFEIVSEPRILQEERRRNIEKIKIRLEDAGTGFTDDVLKEYKEASEREAFLEREIEDLKKSAESLKQLIAELDEKLSLEFEEGVKKINLEFQKFFSLMFGGGIAGLKVVKEKKKKKIADSDVEELLESGGVPAEEEEGESGIDVEINLPQKKVKGLVMLSGGERALTSIALLFAISQVNPPPFIILDETDAALDEANSKKYGDMIENLSKYSQLIVITHNRETMSRAGVLYGVTMGKGGISKLLSIKFEEAVVVAK